LRSPNRLLMGVINERSIDQTVLCFFFPVRAVLLLSPLLSVVRWYCLKLVYRLIVVWFFGECAAGAFDNEVGGVVSASHALSHRVLLYQTG